MSSVALGFTIGRSGADASAAGLSTGAAWVAGAEGGVAGAIAGACDAADGVAIAEGVAGASPGPGWQPSADAMMMNERLVAGDLMRRVYAGSTWLFLDLCRLPPVQAAYFDDAARVTEGFVPGPMTTVLALAEVASWPSCWVRWNSRIDGVRLLATVRL